MDGDARVGGVNIWIKILLLLTIKSILLRLVFLLQVTLICYYLTEGQQEGSIREGYITTNSIVDSQQDVVRKKLIENT